MVDIWTFCASWLWGLYWNCFHLKSHPTKKEKATETEWLLTTEQSSIYKYNTSTSTHLLGHQKWHRPLKTWLEEAFILTVFLGTGDQTDSQNADKQVDKYQKHKKEDQKELGSGCGSRLGAIKHGNRRYVSGGPCEVSDTNRQQYKTHHLL